MLLQILRYRSCLPRSWVRHHQINPDIHLLLKIFVVKPKLLFLSCFKFIILFISLRVSTVIVRIGTQIIEAFANKIGLSHRAIKLFKLCSDEWIVYFPKLVDKCEFRKTMFGLNPPMQMLLRVRKEFTFILCVNFDSDNILDIFYVIEFKIILMRLSAWILVESGTKKNKIHSAQCSLIELSIVLIIRG